MSNELTITIFIFAVSLFVLIKSSDYLVKYSEKVGLALGVPQFIIGITLISAGTSLPELAASIFSIAKDEPGVVAGNVIGSNVANILLVLGITMIISKKIELKKSLIDIDLPLLAASAAILVVTMMDGKFTLFEAIISLVGFVIYLVYSFTHQKKDLLNLVEESVDGEGKSSIFKKKPPFKWLHILLILLSAVTLYLSADFTIDSVKTLGAMLNINTAIIAITAIAIGTSLPELFVSISAARRGNFDIVFGNIIGSSIFNGFLVMGISGTISELPVEAPVILIGIPFFILATILLIFSGIERKFYNFEGAFFIVLYLIFIEQLYQTII